MCRPITILYLLPTYCEGAAVSGSVDRFTLCCLGKCADNGFRGLGRPCPCPWEEGKWETSTGIWPSCANFLDSPLNRKAATGAFGSSNSKALFPLTASNIFDRKSSETSIATKRIKSIGLIKHHIKNGVKHTHCHVCVIALRHIHSLAFG